VSATSLFISVKLPTSYSREELISKLNSNLPDEIRVFDAIHSSKRFDANLFCDARTYNFHVPMYMFLPFSQYPEDLKTRFAQLTE
jgi:tRNA pseudouridine(38-40) synthase